ncbi:MAG TPA: thiol-disulfide oxidoreductase DCC family protein [Bacteroidota bacterium]|nr:thiol-disulfide oxidoreductase DCC family protein [Bacteroidota bacterium]
MTQNAEHPIVLFDGVCGLCDRFVQFVIKHDKDGVVRFAALQSDAAQPLLKKFGLSGTGLSFIVLVEGDEHYTKSAAVFRTMKHFRGGWKQLSGLRVIPAPISDFVYDFVASHRYRWFGKYDQCVIPTQEQRRRFLSSP